jgi:hypothetical protein
MFMSLNSGISKSDSFLIRKYRPSKGFSFKDVVFKNCHRTSGN